MGAGERGPGSRSGRCRWGIVSRYLHVLHDAIGHVNFGRATLEHLILKTGGQPVCDETNDNPWVLHEPTPHSTLLKCLYVVPNR